MYNKKILELRKTQMYFQRRTTDANGCDDELWGKTTRYSRYDITLEGLVLSHRFIPILITKLEPRVLVACTAQEAAQFGLEMDYNWAYKICSTETRADGEIVAWYISAYQNHPHISSDKLEVNNRACLPAGLRWIRKSQDPKRLDYHILIPAGSENWPRYNKQMVGDWGYESCIAISKSIYADNHPARAAHEDSASANPASANLHSIKTSKVPRYNGTIKRDFNVPKSDEQPKPKITEKSKEQTVEVVKIPEVEVFKIPEVEVYQPSNPQLIDNARANEFTYGY